MEHFALVDEHHAFAYANMGQCGYFICIAFERDTYYLLDVFHARDSFCAKCDKEVVENTPCLHFSFHEGDIHQIESAVKEYVERHFLKKALSYPYPLQYRRSFQVKHNQDKVIELNLIAIKRQEVIEAYGSTFNFYVTKKGEKTIYVTRKKQERKTKPKQTFLLNPIQVEKMMANIMPVNEELKKIEQEWVQKYDVNLTKWNKMTQLIEAMKMSMLLYQHVYDNYQDHSLRDMLTFLYEILWREIPLRDISHDGDAKRRDEVSSIMQRYMIDAISSQECLNQLVGDPDAYLPKRMERIIYGFKILLKAKDVYLNIKKLGVEGAEHWHMNFCDLMVLYIKIELGVAFKSNEEQEAIETYIFNLFAQVEKGEIEEKDMYEKIDHAIPYIHEFDYEAINRYLQTINKKKPSYVFYLMQIRFQGDFMESLSQHEAYNYQKNIDMVPCNLFQEGASVLLKWMTEKEASSLLHQIKQLEEVPGSMKTWEVTHPIYPQANEYVIFDGKKLYRLHFRKEP